jgi:hypothetical protein
LVGDLVDAGLRTGFVIVTAGRTTYTDAPDRLVVDLYGRPPKVAITPLVVPSPREMGLSRSRWENARVV